MRAQTHIAGALCSYGLTALVAGLPLTPATAAVAAVCGTLPDIDTRGSTVGRIFSPIARFIERRYGHRTLTHSYAGQVGFAVVLAPLWWFPGPAYYTAAVVGYASHPALDTMTVDGIRGFWPWADVRCVFPYYEGRPSAYRTRTGSRGDSLFCALFCILLIPIIFLNIMSYQRVIRVVQGDASSAVRDYLEMSQTHLVEVRLRADDPTSGRSLDGTYNAVGSTDTNTLLIRDADGAVFSVGRPYSANFTARRAVAYPTTPVQVSSRSLPMRGRLLADLDDWIPRGITQNNRAHHHLSGRVRLEEPVEITPDPTRYSTLSSTGQTLRLSHATIADLEAHGLMGALITQGSVTLRLFLTPTQAEIYPDHGSTERRLRRVAFEHERAHAPLLLVRRGDGVAEGDTLAVVDDGTAALARTKLNNLLLQQTELRVEAAGASLQRALYRSRDNRRAADSALSLAEDRHARGFVSAGALEQARTRVAEATREEALAQQELDRYRTDHRRRLRSIEEQIAQARLQLQTLEAATVVRSPVAGAVERIEEHTRPDGEVEVRFLIGAQPASQSAPDSLATAASTRPS